MRKCVMQAIVCAIPAMFFASIANAQESDEAPQSAPVEAKAERQLDIRQYHIEGNSVLPRTVVEDAVLPYLGPQRPVSDVEKARAALEKAYRTHGYEAVGVEIPAQDVRDGVVKLKVVELKVGRLRVVDSRYFSPQDIKDRVPSLKEGAVPNYRDVAQEMVAVNKSADRTITPTLRAGGEPDTIDVDLRVEDRLPLHATMELNDRRSSSTDRLRLSGSLSFSNLFQLEHSLNLQGQFTPETPSQSWMASASYVVPLRDTPFTFVGYAVHSKSDVMATGGIGVLGTGNMFGLRALYNAMTGEPGSAFLHQFALGLDYKDFQEDLIADDAKAKTPIHYYPLSLGYTLSHSTESYNFDLGLVLSTGLRGLGSSSARYGEKRYTAEANWTTLKFNTSYSRKLFGDWLASAKLSAQFAGEALISNEQYAAGGLDSVRGYLESQQLGDDGIGGQLQIETPSMHHWSSGVLNEWRLFAFADGAMLRIYNPLTYSDASLEDQASHTELGSAGIGTRFRAFEYFNASVALAVPLIDRKSVPTDIDGHVRVLFRVWAEL